MPKRQSPQTLAKLAMASLVVLNTNAWAFDDPMRPPNLIKPRTTKSQIQQPLIITTPNFKLLSTLVAKERRIAVINDQIVAIGDVIQGAIVTDIDDQTVSLSFQGRSILLQLLEQQNTDKLRQTP